MARTFTLWSAHQVRDVDGIVWSDSLAGILKGRFYMDPWVFDDSHGLVYQPTKSDVEKVIFRFDDGTTAETSNIFQSPSGGHTWITFTVPHHEWDRQRIECDWLTNPLQRRGLVQIDVVVAEPSWEYLTEQERAARWFI